jgi:DNA-binding MarR family transcriptional regulator
MTNINISMDFLNNIGALALGSRLKRLSDICMGETRTIYRAAGFAFEPRWFPLCFLLRQQGQVTVMDAASMLGVPHPYVSQLIKELRQARLVVWRRHPSDGRSRILILSPKGQDLIAELEPLWKDIDDAVKTMIQQTSADFLETLEKIERTLTETPLSQIVQRKRKSRLTQSVRIVEYQPIFKEWFERLNREWLEKYFSVEPVDVQCFSNPEREIIKKGGSIIFAELQGEIVGTCALIYEDGVCELARMAVTASAQGQGIGELLAKEIIGRAQSNGERCLTLATNSRLAPAVGLYKKLGFQETFRGPHLKYARSNMTMELQLGTVLG